MANIASGYLWIGLADGSAVAELATAIKNTDCFSYGGDVNIEIGNGGLDVIFSCAWNGEDSWEWIDTQLTEGGKLSPQSQAALIDSEISGYTYEYGCRHRDRVRKSIGERKLKRQQARIPDDIVTALKISKAFDLSPSEPRLVSGGTVTLISKQASEDAQGETIYTFSLACSYCLKLTLRINESSLYANETDCTISSAEIDGQDVDVGDQEYALVVMEIIDDIVASFDEIYEASEPGLTSEAQDDDKEVIDYVITVAPDGSLLLTRPYLELLDLWPGDCFILEVNRCRESMACRSQR